MVQVVASYPVGVFADRLGSLPVLVVGYMLGVTTALLTATAFLLEADSLALLAAIFVIAGLYMAVQEALKSTVTAGLVSQETIGTSRGALGTVNGTTKFVSSTAVGVLWTPS